MTIISSAHLAAKNSPVFKMNFAKKATALAMSVLFAVSMAGCGSSASTAKKVEVTSVEDLADLKI